MIIAVDFDGTLAVTKFPEIISPKENVIRFCKESKERGDILILWTCRTGESLDAAVEWCKTQGLIFDYVNENPPDRVALWGDPRKVYADVYIDDRSREVYDGRLIKMI